jgi:perosamine synthetase
MSADIASILELSDCFYFSRGRVALYALLKAMDIKENDEVIIQAFTCLAVPNPIISLGAKPVYVDIDPKNYDMDPSSIEEKITRKTKAIIVQHTYGVPAEMDRILEISGKYKLYVIEDSCHAVGSKYKEKEVGSFGDAAFFSFGWEKPIAIGDGGCVITNNPEIKDRLEITYRDFNDPPFIEMSMLRIEYFLGSIFLAPSLFWFVRSFYRSLAKLAVINGTFSSEELQFEGGVPDYYRNKMSGWQKGVLLRELYDIENLIKHRRWVVSQYEQLLAEIGIEPIKLSRYFEPVYLRYPVLVEDKRSVLAEARKSRAEVGDWFTSPIHPVPEESWKLVGYEKGSCPIAERACKRLVNLPTYKRVREEDILRIISVLRDVSNN